MKPFGKTYLIECESIENITFENNIYVVNNSNRLTDGHWKGIIKDYGTGFSDEEIKNLVPIGTKVVMSFGKNTNDKGGTKLNIGKKVFYIRNENEILGIIENE